VLDSVEITPHRAEAAEELFEILTHPSVSRRRVPVLIACNKQDLEAQAHSLDFIRCGSLCAVYITVSSRRPASSAESLDLSPLLELFGEVMLSGGAIANSRQTDRPQPPRSPAR